METHSNRSHNNVTVVFALSRNLAWVNGGWLSSKQSVHCKEFKGKGNVALPNATDKMSWLLFGAVSSNANLPRDTKRMWRSRITGNMISDHWHEQSRLKSMQNEEVLLLFINLPPGSHAKIVSMEYLDYKSHIDISLISQEDGLDRLPWQSCPGTVNV
jgi:hypothetical protein